MATQKAKFELFSRLQGLGFTYDESAALRRIEMTLKRWAERECGDGSNWAIERDEATGKPFNVYHGPGKRHQYAIADREAGALKRAKALADAVNKRRYLMPDCDDFLSVYHQGDCRGCMLYLIRTKDVPMGADVESYYSRGFAVCV